MWNLRFLMTVRRHFLYIQWPRKIWKLFVELPPFTSGLMEEWLLRKAVKSREGKVVEFFFIFPVIGIE